MAKANCNGIEIEYETFGDRSGRPLIMIIGLGSQLINWSEEILQQLVDEGHFVVTLDNRDTGLSGKMSEAGLPDFMEVMNVLDRGEKPKVPYTLTDMGEDVVGLMDALGIRKAHICGVSMGGAIAQTIAINHLSRLSSLVLIYSPTGNPGLPKAKPEIMSLLMPPVASNRDEYADEQIKMRRIISGSGFPLDEEWLRLRYARVFDRSYYPDGMRRNAIAVFASGNRSTALSSVTVPTLVVHGDDDPLVPLENGRDAAQAIPGAELMIIKGMGHYPPHKGPWPRIAEAITAHTKKSSV